MIAFTWIGILVSALAVTLAIMFATVFTVMWLLERWPRLHCGVPKLSSEWLFFRETRDKPEQVYVVPWWFGWSSRRKASWFIGLVRMRAKP